MPIFHAKKPPISPANDAPAKMEGVTESGGGGERRWVVVLEEGVDEWWRRREGMGRGRGGSRWVQAEERGAVVEEGVGGGGVGRWWWERRDVMELKMVKKGGYGRWRRR